MNARTMVCVALGAAILVVPVLFAEDSGDNEEWLNKHAVTRITQTTDRDANGNIKSVKEIKDTTIYIRQTVSETKKPDGKGGIRTVSRITTSSDTLGGSATITEGIVAGSSDLVTTGITTVEKTAEGLVTTVYARDKTGNMALVNRITSVITNNGVAPTVVAVQ